MNTKLTLSIDYKIIKQAKKFANQRNKSLSKLIEDYLGGIIKGFIIGNSITGEKHSKIEELNL